MAGWLKRWTVNPVAKSSTPGRIRMKDHFSVLPSQHLRRLVSAFSLAFGCKARTKIVANVKDTMPTFRKRRLGNAQITFDSGRIIKMMIVYIGYSKWRKEVLSSTYATMFSKMDLRFTQTRRNSTLRGTPAVCLQWWVRVRHPWWGIADAEVTTTGLRTRSYRRFSH